MTNQDASKVLLGSTGSNERDVTCEPGDPAVCKAGLAVTRGSDGDLDLGGAAGSFLGVSAGKSLSDTDKLAVVRTGLRVPIKLQDDNVFASLVKAELTFTAKTLRGTDGEAISIVFVDDGVSGSETVDVVDLKITVHMDDTPITGTTAQNAVDAIEASAEADALVSVAIAEGEEATVQNDFVEDFLGDATDAFSWVVVGAPVEIDGDTGEATDDDEATGGVYASGPLSAIDPFTGLQDGYAALVDMVGGL